MFRNVAPGKLREITIQFKPRLGFALMTSPANKRAWARYLAYRNYKERQGKHIKFMQPGAELEIMVLRARLDEIAKMLETGILHYSLQIEIQEKQ